MKKKISVLLAIVMFLGIMPVLPFANGSIIDNGVHAKEYWDVDEYDEYFEAVYVLSELGIITGFDDDTFKPNEYVTRAQMTTLIVKALDEQGYNYNFKGVVKFKDVSPDHWAAIYIAEGVREKFISGYSDTEFGPEDNITYLQATKMLASVMGYDDLCQRAGGWPDGYKKYGQILGIGDGVYANGDNYVLTRGDVAIMIYNAMNAPVCMGGIIKDGTGADFQNLFTLKHDVYKVQGYVKDKNTFIITYANNYDDNYYPSESKESIRLPNIYGWDDRGSQVLHENYGIDNVGVPCTALIHNQFIGTSILYTFDYDNQERFDDIGLDSDDELELDFDDELELDSDDELEFDIDDIVFG